MDNEFARRLGLGGGLGQNMGLGQQNGGCNVQTYTVGNAPNLNWDSVVFGMPISPYHNDGQYEAMMRLVEKWNKGNEPVETNLQSMMYAISNLRSQIAEYANFGVEPPRSLLDDLAERERKTRQLIEDDKAAELAAAKAELDVLKSKEDRRKELQAKIEKLEGKK